MILTSSSLSPEASGGPFPHCPHLSWVSASPLTQIFSTSPECFHLPLEPPTRAHWKFSPVSKISFSHCNFSPFCLSVLERCSLIIGSMLGRDAPVNHSSGPLGVGVWKGSLHIGHTAERRVYSQVWQPWHILGTDPDSQNKSQELGLP